MKGWFLLFLLGAPNLQEILPNKAKPGGIIFLLGSGFGTEKEGVTVQFGKVPGKVLSASDGKLSVQIPWEAPKVCDISVV